MYKTTLTMDFNKSCRWFLLAFVVIASQLVAFCHGHAVDDDIPEAIVGHGLVDFTRILGMTDLVETTLSEGVSGDKEITVLSFTQEGVDEVADFFNGLDKQGLTNLLLYHMLPKEVSKAGFTETKSYETLLPGYFMDVTVETPGEPMFGAEEATIGFADIGASNGIIHVLTKIVIPPEGFETVSTTAEMLPPSVYDIIASDKKLKPLKKKLEEFGLVEILSDPDATFTLFAPDRKAFNKADENFGTEASDLLHHVYSDGVLLSTGLASGDLTMADGTDVSVQVKTKRNGDIKSVKLDKKSRIRKADLVAQNGVVHVINKVLVAPTE